MNASDAIVLSRERAQLKIMRHVDSMLRVFHKRIKHAVKQGYSGTQVYFDLPAKLWSFRKEIFDAVQEVLQTQGYIAHITNASNSVEFDYRIDITWI